MDKVATIIVLGIVALIAIPFILNKLYNKTKLNKFHKDFMSLAEKDKVVFSKIELWNNRYAIGIDNNSRKLLYASKQNDKIEGTLIDLSDIEKCRIANINRTLKNQYGKSNISDRLELVFSFRNPALPEKVLEFYDSTEFMPTEDDLAFIENWSQLVNSNINSSRN